MSRYLIPAAAYGYRVVVGWDPPLHTLFGQVHDRTIEEHLDDPRNPCVLWVGTDEGAITDIETLRRAMQRYASIPADVEAQLLADMAAPDTRAPPQKHLLAMLRQGRGMPEDMRGNMS